ALAGAGYTEVLNYPFVGEGVGDLLRLGPQDPFRRTVKLVNPLSDEEPALRPALLPGLLTALRRNHGRSSQGAQGGLALFETGLVFNPSGDEPDASRPDVAGRPSGDEIAALDAALPRQPRHVAVALAGPREQSGWWGEGRPSGWADAVEAARTVAREAGVELTVTGAQYGPWHPGRCARLNVGERVVGFAGELHPRVTKAFGLPDRACATELDLDALEEAVDGPVRAPAVSTFPVAAQDVALVVDEGVPASEVETALRKGAGALLESLRLFDVFTGEQLGEGRKSLAYALRFRAHDRTLKADEASAARDAAVAAAVEQTGAVLRGS
ncbi:hypothetical protein N566_00785, partial [Streptomycetaceae bacterium MP113-05]